MSHPSPTVGELFEAKAVTDDQVNTAVDAYLSNLEVGIFPIVDGYVVDVDAAVVKHPWASLVIANEESSLTLKRGIVRMAILLARAQKA